MIVWGGEGVFRRRPTCSTSTGGRYDPGDRQLDADIDGAGVPDGAEDAPHGGLDRHGDDRLGRTATTADREHYGGGALRPGDSWTPTSTANRAGGAARDTRRSGPARR